MKPVDQDKFYDKEKGSKGNCLQAAVASILELSVDVVPNFHDCPEGFWPGYHNFLEKHGYIAFELRQIICPECFYLAFGPSPRGVDHAVIYFEGKLAHDPHPSRAGIKLEIIHMLVPIRPRSMI